MQGQDARFLTSMEAKPRERNNCLIQKSAEIALVYIRIRILCMYNCIGGDRTFVRCREGSENAIWRWLRGVYIGSEGP